jgi:hypothetical protein
MRAAVFHFSPFVVSDLVPSGQFMNCPYRKLFLVISQIEDNFKLEVGDSQTAQLKMPVSVVSTAVSTNNYPFLMRE